MEPEPVSAPPEVTLSPAITTLIVEGGGAKLAALPGAIEVLEERGVMTNIKRFAGSGTSSLFAALLACGADSRALEDVWRTVSLRSLVEDASFGKLSIAPNLLNNYGWHPAHKLSEFLSHQMKKLTGKSTTTFHELFELKGVQLCVVASNLNSLEEEYLHVKTTPNLPIVEAVRFSMTSPGSVQVYESKHVPDVLISGSLLYNYPIHAFDGWWLSMQEEDNFFARLGSLQLIKQNMERSVRFQRTTQESDSVLGLLFFAESEMDIYKSELLERLRNHCSSVPRPSSSKVLKKHLHHFGEKDSSEAKADMREAIDGLLQSLKKANIDENCRAISFAELKKALIDHVAVPPEKMKILFGSGYTPEKVMEALDSDGDGLITFSELFNFCQSKGVQLLQTTVAGQRARIHSFGSYWSAVQETVEINMKKLQVTESDKRRSAGVFTDYITSDSYDLEPQDLEFAKKCGRNAIEAFFASNQP